MSDYEPLNRSKHERLRMGPTDGYAQFRETTLVPIILDEIAMVAREYPIIFPEGEADLPCALTGVQPQTNAYLDKEGRWQAQYIPMDVRKQPFGLAPVEGSQDASGKLRYTLCINPGAHEFTDLEGARVFQPGGELSPEANAKAELARKLLERSGITKAMVKALEEAELLVPRAIQMNLGQEMRKIQGFRVVDEKKLNSLSDEEFAALRNKGLLPLIYAQLMSMANLRLGVLAGQIRPKATGDVAETKKTVDSDFDIGIFADDDGDFDIFH